MTNLLASIKLQAYSPPLPIETDRIHVANGTYFMDGSFTADKSYCNNRLTVAYNPDAPTPKRWLQFLSELLQPEDIPTLQEFLGYCLLPTTKGQKMLMLIGKGGEGKKPHWSCHALAAGDSMNTTSIQKVESNRFSRADLEKLHRLIGNNYQFSISGKAKENMETVKRSSNNVIEFLQSEGYIRFRADSEASSKALYEAYQRWCEDNAQKSMSANRLSSELAQNERLTRGGHQQCPCRW